MKKSLMILPLILLTACVQQTVNLGSRGFEGYSFRDVWRATIRTINDMDYTVYAMDRDAGFIGAETGRHPFQDYPPRLSIMISEDYGKVFVECKVLQLEQFIDILGYGKKTVRRFMYTLRENLRAVN